MTKEELQERVKQMALRVIRLAESLPKSKTSNVIAYQIIKSATSAAANYRAACKARSKAEFIAKLAIVEEETVETLFWIEMIVGANLFSWERIEGLYDEIQQLAKIFASSRKTAAKNKNAHGFQQSEIDNRK